ncbi:hypothetical protein M601_019230 [Cellulophaga baltica 4]|nr:hypothetical protein M601_019230 [Cellulophaga baltica 4]
MKSKTKNLENRKTWDQQLKKANSIKNEEILIPYIFEDEILEDWNW